MIDIEKVGVGYMEQLLIVEDDIGLNQGLCKALKAATLRRCIPDPVGY